MTRSLVGMATALVLSLTPGLVTAQEQPRVQVSRTKEQARISMQSGKLRVTQTLTRKGFDLQLTEGADTIRLTGDLAGRLSLTRGARQHAFSIRTPGAEDQATVVSMLSGSLALRSFDSAMATEWGKSKSSTAAVFRAAHSMIGLLRGTTQPMAAIIASQASPKASIVRVRDEGPAACWEQYTHDVIRYTFELEACVDEANDSIFPLHLAWCAYEYDIKTSLALIWLLDCSGVL